MRSPDKTKLSFVVSSRGLLPFLRDGALGWDGDGDGATASVSGFPSAPARAHVCLCVYVRVCVCVCVHELTGWGRRDVFVYARKCAHA